MGFVFEAQDFGDFERDAKSPLLPLARKISRGVPVDVERPIVAMWAAGDLAAIDFFIARSGEVGDICGAYVFVARHLGGFVESDFVAICRRFIANRTMAIFAKDMRKGLCNKRLEPAQVIEPRGDEFGA